LISTASFFCIHPIVTLESLLSSNAAATTELYTLSLHDALPISMRTHYCGQVDEKLLGQEVSVAGWVHRRRDHGGVIFVDLRDREDRKSTRLNSSHVKISYAVFCLKKKRYIQLLNSLSGCARVRF